MIAIFRSAGDIEDDVELNIAPAPITPADAGEAPPRAKTRAPYARPYGNNQLNSRVQAPAPEGMLKVFWQTEFKARFTPTFVVQDGNRIILQPADWQLLNNKDGQQIAALACGPDFAVMDFSTGLFFAPEPSGMVGAFKLKTGERRFAIIPGSPNSFSRPYVARQGKLLYVLSNERDKDGHGKHPPKRSTIDCFDIFNPPQMTPGENLAHYGGRASLRIQSPVAFAIVNDTAVIFTTPDHLCIADADLNVTAIFEAQFTPLAMSMDEGGRIHLLIESGGKTALWVLTADGKRLVDVPMPGLPAEPRPPAIGYDHRIYISCTDRLVALEPNGAEAWSLPGQSNAAITITTDDKVLVSSGPSILSVDSAGKATILIELAGEKFSTPPVVRSDGAILAVSKNKLFCLVPR